MDKRFTFRARRFIEMAAGLAKQHASTQFILLCLFAFLFIAGDRRALAADRLLAVESLIEVQNGDLPILLSAPHGGTESIPDVPPREGVGLARVPGGFVTSRDTGTYELAMAISRELETRYQRKPYMVLSRAHRRFLDPNRPATQAYEDSDAEPIYQRFHDSLADACNEIRSRFGRGLLLDIHGQSSRKDVVFRGTKNGATVGLLRQRFGEAAHSGEHSFLAFLEHYGAAVHPSPFSDPEQAGYTGGYIVQRYGSEEYGVDAIQLEFGASYRTPTARRETAQDVAASIGRFAAEYLGLSAPDPERQVLQVAVYVGEGTSASKKSLLEQLEAVAGFRVRQVQAKDIRDGILGECDILVDPGGSGSAQGRALGEEGREIVREFVAAGGGFVGLCAGAYLASSDYEWSLHLLDAKVIDRQHWARGSGNVAIRVSQAGQALFAGSNEELTIYYHQGPLLAPAAMEAIPDYDPLATYLGEVAKNGAPRGVMPGTTAIASGTYRRGRVLCFSPHPERTPGLESMVHQAIRWAAGN